MLQHPVLMDPAFVRKRVLAYDRLVELHRKSRDGRNQPRGLHDLRRIDIVVIRHNVMANLHRHHDFFQRRVTRAFSKAVNRTFNLPRPCFDSRQGVCRRHAQIVVAVRGDDNLVHARHTLQQHPDNIGTFTRCSITHGIGDINRRRARLDRNLANPRQIVVFGSRRIHR